MKIDEEVRKELIHNLEYWWKEEFNVIIKNLIDQLKKAKTVEEIIQIEQKLLVHFIDLIPLRGYHNYFCIAQELGKIPDNCNDCPYAKVHKPCTIKGSDFDKIFTTSRKLLRNIERLYYKGEKYDE